MQRSTPIIVELPLPGCASVYLRQSDVDKALSWTLNPDRATRFASDEIATNVMADNLSVSVINFRHPPRLY